MTKLLEVWASLAVLGYVFFFCLAFSGCSTAMRASADCSYKAGVKGYGNYYSIDPSGACNFHLESPIKQSADAGNFAHAFKTMFLAIPETEGIVKPELKVEIDKK